MDSWLKIEGLLIVFIIVEAQSPATASHGHHTSVDALSILHCILMLETYVNISS
jgi:hypothetical protein